eukprot:scaffold1847_cov343-Prasinococcus_capsulatus_cf.AAC.15
MRAVAPAAPASRTAAAAAAAAKKERRHIRRHSHWPAPAGKRFHPVVEVHLPRGTARAARTCCPPDAAGEVRSAAGRDGADNEEEEEEEQQQQQQQEQDAQARPRSALAAARGDGRRLAGLS